MGGTAVVTITYAAAYGLAVRCILPEDGTVDSLFGAGDTVRPADIKDHYIIHPSISVDKGTYVAETEIDPIVVDFFAVGDNSDESEKSHAIDSGNALAGYPVTLQVVDNAVVFDKITTTFPDESQVTYFGSHHLESTWWNVTDGYGQFVPGLSTIKVSYEGTFWYVWFRINTVPPVEYPLFRELFIVNFATDKTKTAEIFIFPGQPFDYKIDYYPGGTTFVLNADATVSATNGAGNPVLPAKTFSGSGSDGVSQYFTGSGLSTL